MERTGTVESGLRAKRYPNDIDPILGYAPGRILTDELMDYRSAQAAEAVLLRRYGYMTIPALHYPGASKSLMIHLANPSAQTLTPKEIVAALDDAFTTVARIIGSRQKLEAVLFGPPDAQIPD